MLNRKPASSIQEKPISADGIDWNRMEKPVLAPHNGREDYRGVEDPRVTPLDGRFYMTYTAYGENSYYPMIAASDNLITWEDVGPLEKARNKDHILFPEKINGRYAMLSRIDGWNNYIMYSDNINVWDNPVKIQSPVYPWELVQIGNCGSPIETDEGWLVITHAVGPMRTYSIGASLLDLENPEREIGRLREPLLMPSSEEREGYVPNVVYSCGSIIHNGELILPYGLSDHSSGFATVKLDLLLEKLKAGG